MSPKEYDDEMSQATACTDLVQQTIPKFTTKRTRALARSPGRNVPRGRSPQQLKNPKFMSRTQREAFNNGEEIWV